MKCLLCCSVQVQETKTKILEISPEANLDTFGQVRKDTTATRKKNTTRSVDNPMEGSSTKKKQPPDDLAWLFNSTTKQKNKNKKANQPSVQKREIAIQAGSPLSKTRKGKIETTIFFSNEEDPRASSFGKLANNIKTLNPLKKNPLSKRLNGNQKKGDITLDPIDTSIPKKLVPVDKDFLKRLEKAASQNNNETQQQQHPKSEVKRHKALLAVGKKRNKNAPTLIKKRSTTAKSKKKPDVTDKSQDNEVSPFKELFNEEPLQHHSENNSNDKVNNNKDGDHEMYDSDELDLMDQIEKEFAL